MIHRSTSNATGETETKGKTVANYDTPGVTFDSGLTYADAVGLQPNKRMPKVKVKLNLSTKSDASLLLYAQQHQTAVTGNANFTTLLPSAANFTAALTPFVTALANFNTAQAAAKTATTVKETARAALENVLTQRGNYVELTAASAADPAAVIESANFSIKAGFAPVGEMPAPENVSATGGDQEGECDLHWNPVNGRTNYLAEHRTTPSGPWIQFYAGKKSSATATGLVSGTQYDFRIRAVGAAGPGAWSDLAQSRAT